jgi:hypothetical protein
MGGRVDEEVMEQKLANLMRLLRQPLPTPDAGDVGAWQPLLRIASGLHVLVRSHKRWWRWFGRQRRITRFTERKLELFIAQALSRYGMREDGTVSLPGGKGARDIVQERGEVWRALVGETSAGLLGRLLYEHMPQHDRLVRDIDVWQEPTERVWSEAQLDDARRQERRRAGRQEELRQANAGEREAMLVYADTPFAAERPEEHAPDHEARAPVEVASA